MSKIALITGGSRGIGKGIAVVLARNGIHVVIVGRKKETLEITVNEIRNAGGQADMYIADTTDLDQVKLMASSVIGEIGVPDILVNNAGTGALGDFCEPDYETWKSVIDVNILGYLYVLGEFLKDMKSRGHGHVITIGSIAGKDPTAGGAVYAGTKSFWTGAIQSLREEMKGSGIKFTRLEPRFVRSDGFKAAAVDKEFFQKVQKMFPNTDKNWDENRIMENEDIGEVVWDLVNKPSRVYCQDLYVYDSLEV